MAECFKIIPTTNEYVKLEKDCKLPIHDRCEHGKSTYYPAFHIGLKEPFVILMGLCKECAAAATIATLLTEERWKRMQMILIAHDERIPDRNTIRLELVKSIPPPPTDWQRKIQDANSYSYALAA